MTSVANAHKAQISWPGFGKAIQEQGLMGQKGLTKYPVPVGAVCPGQAGLISLARNVPDHPCALGRDSHGKNHFWKWKEVDEVVIF